VKEKEEKVGGLVLGQKNQFFGKKFFNVDKAFLMIQTMD
jgi:hypothetical protein